MNRSQQNHPPEATPNRGRVSWMFYDWAENAFVTVIQTFLFAAYFTRSVATDPASGTALWGYMIGVTGVIVAVAGPLLGAAADQMGRRKPWIAAFALLCIVSTALLWFVRPTPQDVWLALLLVGLGTIGSELSLVFYNAMLPSLVPRERLGTWSGWGWSMGYAGGLGCLVAVLVLFVWNEGRWFGLDADRAEHIRAAFVFVAVWHLVFSIPLMLRTPDAAPSGKRAALVLRDGWNQLLHTLGELRRYRHVLWFVIGKMLFVNGLVIIFVFGGVYAAGTFDMTAEQVLMFGIAMNVTAGLGAFAFAWVDDRIGGKRTILISLAGLLLFTAVILLVRSQAMFWTFGLALGVFVGPVQAASRSLLARIAPPEMRNQMFGLYALAGKATAFLGPLLVAAITQWTGSQRLGLSVILLFFAAGFVIIARLPRDAPGKQ